MLTPESVGGVLDGEHEDRADAVGRGRTSSSRESALRRGRTATRDPERDRDGPQKERPGTRRKTRGAPPGRAGTSRPTTAVPNREGEQQDDEDGARLHAPPPRLGRAERRRRRRHLRHLLPGQLPGRSAGRRSSPPGPRRPGTAWPQAEPREGLLEISGNRVVDQGFDPRPRRNARNSSRAATRSTKRCTRMRPRHFRGEDEGQPGQNFAVPTGDAAPGGVPGIEPGRSCAPRTAPAGTRGVVVSQHRVISTRRPGHDCAASAVAGEAGTVGDEGTALAVCSKVLSGVEELNAAAAPNLPAFHPRCSAPCAWRGIFEEEEAAARREIGASS